MCLVVHKPFKFNGRQLRRGDVLFGSDADAVVLNPMQYPNCSPAADHHFEHLRPKVDAGFAKVDSR